MCGICGWFGQTPELPIALFDQQSRLLHHRGPDDQGFKQGAGWGLGFRRLSILDLSELGHQPMQTMDGRYWLAFNGEIYNYVELRTALAREGEQFYGSSDTEVLLRLLARKGPQALETLNGMFALAFVDSVQRTFLVARDRLGKKPLYYQARTGQFRFASELKALLAWPDAERALNLSAVAEYMAYGYLPNTACIFQGYQKLPAGHSLFGSLDAPERATLAPYWQLQINDSMAEGALNKPDLEKLTDLLTDAVRIRLRSDVPVGIFLSGGLDSGLVAALTNVADARVNPIALTVGFDDEAYDETILAQAIGRQTNLAHKLVNQRMYSLDHVDQIGWFYDEPFGDASALPTMALCAAASKYATVFLSGDGGDEAFAGYRRYIETQRLQWLAHLPPAVGTSMQWLARLLPMFSRIRYLLDKSSLPDAGFAAAFDGIPNDSVLPYLAGTALQPYIAGAGFTLWQHWANSQGQQLTARQQMLDYSMYLPDDILVKMDRAAMAHSIEVRSPLLDYRLVEWAASLPRSVLLNDQFGKLPLRELGKTLLPAPVQKGHKRGFGVPLDSWFRQPTGQNFLRERLLSAEAKRRQLWNVDHVKALIDRHQTDTKRQYGEYLWRLLILDAWARYYLDEPRFLQGPPHMAARNVEDNGSLQKVYAGF
ncbi:MAG: asparagine synthase (glutamine-hydrolyzing) [Chloroflexi bacterium]|nr:asparagine synthase (glutamine-hydrolyzing) [Chloroflexota bacterium]